MATQVKFNRLHTLAEAQLSTADQNTIYFTTDTHEVVMKGEIYGANYILPVASTTDLGGVKLGSDTVQMVAANTPTSVADRTYAVQVNSSGQMAVNIPWTNSLPVWENEINNNEIWYTSSDGNIVTPYQTSSLPKIDTNTYSDGKGVIKFKADVTSIGKYAFYNCTSLTSVTIPDSTASIGENAFALCKGLTSVTIPDSVTSIGESAFYGCTHLTSITIPNSVTSIGNAAFYGCTHLTSITIPDNVTSIGEAAFHSCNHLTSITIPNGITDIERYTFQRCIRLTSVTIPNSVTSIGENAFIGCSGLTSVTIPDGVTSIGNQAFENCTGLTSVTCEATTPPTIDSFTWYNVTKSIPVYVPADSVSLYQQAQYWSQFTNIQAIQ